MRLRLLTGSALVALAIVVAVSGVVRALAVDISGAWNFTWTTDGGVRESTIEFVQEGETLTATTDKQTLKGSIKDDAFEVKGEFYSAEGGGSAPLTIKGKVDGDRLVGSGSWSEYGMTFTAVRAK
jgi:hypothetical protein